MHTETDQAKYLSQKYPYCYHRNTLDKVGLIESIHIEGRASELYTTIYLCTQSTVNHRGSNKAIYTYTVDALTAELFTQPLKSIESQRLLADGSMTHVQHERPV